MQYSHTTLSATSLKRRWNSMRKSSPFTLKHLKRQRKSARRRTRTTTRHTSEQPFTILVSCIYSDLTLKKLYPFLRRRLTTGKNILVQELSITWYVIQLTCFSKELAKQVLTSLIPTRVCAGITWKDRIVPLCYGRIRNRP
jgi:hypothetical protein